MHQELGIIGNLTKDPTLKYLPSGTAVADFTVAVNGTKTVQGSTVKTVTWFRCAAWGKQAETVNQYLTKGSQVFVKGELVADEHGNPPIWTNKQGEARAEFKVNASKVKFLSRSTGNGAPAAAADDDDDGIPW